MTFIIFLASELFLLYSCLTWDPEESFFDVNPYDPFLIMLLPTILSGLLCFRNVIKKRFLGIDSNESRLIKKFGNFIKNNKLYLTNSDGYISRAAEIEFSTQDDGGIIVNVDALGSRFTDQTRHLDNELESLLKMEMDDKRNDVGSTTYYFGCMEPKAFEYPFIKVFKDPYLVPITPSISWNMKECPHALIAGTTGGGKTYFLLHLLSYLKYFSKAEIYVCDPKGSDLYQAAQRMDVETAYDANGTAKYIRIVKESMEKRYEAERMLFNYYKDPRETLQTKPLVLIIDEVGACLAQIDKKEKEKVLNNLKQIIFKGRQSGVFVILATQKPDAETISTDIRDQLGLRVVVGNLSADGYKMIFGCQEDKEYRWCRPGTGYLYMGGQAFRTPQFFLAPVIDTKSYLFDPVPKEEDVLDDKDYSKADAKPLYFPRYPEKF